MKSQECNQVVYGCPPKGNYSMHDVNYLHHMITSLCLEMAFNRNQQSAQNYVESESPIQCFTRQLQRLLQGLQSRKSSFWINKGKDSGHNEHLGVTPIDGKPQ